MTIKHVASAFESDLVVLPLACLLPLKQVTEVIKKSEKYLAIAASIGEVGVIEPLVVFRKPDRRGRFLLLDGSLRREILTDRGIVEAECLLATDDEAFTYNKSVNRLAVVQEHFLILRAIERGVSEQKIARALNVNVDQIKRRRRMLKGICPQAVHLLRDKSVNPVTFDLLRKMKATRQTEACELMVAASNYSSSYAKALLAATKDEDRVKPARPLCPAVATLADLSLMERELKQVQQDLKEVETSYGRDMLDLVIAARYVSRLLGSRTVAHYLEDNHPEIAREFRTIVFETLPVPATPS
ncbi:plasmid partitioning protein RepB C-terminal domain-containing protein [Bradyrhizobium sp.]|uniref:plasmid partitioning protein RepB C-terminal domain-containing protein n=1 Tax=Bradyrhizobium sp. TaxID=376 RepID=UPI0040379146